MTARGAFGICRLSFPCRGASMLRSSMCCYATILFALLIAGSPLHAQNETPEQLLANTITALQSGNPDYATMTPSMANDIRPQAAKLQESLASFGTVTLVRRDSARQGQHFIVEHTNGATRWHLVLDDTGRIKGLWYWNLAPRWELQRQIHALHDGKPDYASMTGSLADAIRPQAGALQQTLIGLGPVTNVIHETDATYLVQHGNGQARWRIYFDNNHKVSGLWVKTLSLPSAPAPTAVQPGYAGNTPAPVDDDGGFFSFLGAALEVAAVVSDTSGTAYNDYVSQNVTALSGLAELANAAAMADQAAPSAGVATGKGAVTPGSYPARRNTLDGSAACAGYSVDNYKEYFEMNSQGPDVQLHTLCAGAYNYYWMYLNAIRQGYSKSESDRTYRAFQDAALVATDFYAKTRTR